jgi:ATP-dependent DNA helicase RecG
MEHILKLSERIEIAIEIGESYYREFKSAFVGRPGEKKPRDVSEICSDIAKTIVAFSNADGGELFVGIEDDFEITGCPHKREDIQQMINACAVYVLRDTPITPKQACVISYDGKSIIYFAINKGDNYVYLTSKGECFQRKDRESVPTASEKIMFERNEKASIEYDRQFIDSAKISDLKLDLVAEASKNILRNISPEKFLQYLDLAEFNGERLVLRRAALLLFATNPLKWHPRQQVRIVRVNGTEEKAGADFNVTEIAEVTGNILELIENSWETLRPNLSETRFKGSIFKTQIIYPELACKEALINAITHRDYSAEGRGIEVKIFDDKMVIINPGQLLQTIKLKDIEQLKGVHQSRNSYVARALREIGYIRELGEGIKRIYELMQINDLVKPVLVSENNTFSITLYYRYIFTKEEKLWLDQFDNLQLSREQKTIVRLGINNRLVSTREIFDAVGIISEEVYRQLIESLRNLGILETKLSQTEITNIAAKQKISRKAVPRYLIQIPLSEVKPIKEEDIDKSEYAQIHVSNLHFNADEDDVKASLGKFGDIVDVRIPEVGPGRNKGFCFVEYEKIESAFNAYRSKEMIFIKGRPIRIQIVKKV